MTTSYNPFSLAGKTILVTGASSGIGKATALECARCGAKIVITGRNAHRLSQTLSELPGEGHIALQADLNNEYDLKELVDKCSTLDAAIFCSGIFMLTPCTFSSSEKFQEVYRTNLFAPIELSRLLVKKKKIKKFGSIVYTSSIAGTGAGNGNAIYGSGKAALNSWAKYFALELKPKAIRVNTISPGMISTPAVLDSEGQVSPEQHQLARQGYLYNRYGEPEEVAQAMVYLVSDASKWITGTNLIIDGGVSLKQQ